MPHTDHEYRLAVSKLKSAKRERDLLAKTIRNLLLAKTDRERDRMVKSAELILSELET